MTAALVAVVVVVVVLALLILIAFATGFRVINEYERGVVLRLGRLIDVKGPGPRLIIPFGFDRMVKVDLRVMVHEVPAQDVITSDNVTVRVTAVVFFRVVDARDSYVKVRDYMNTISKTAQTTLRSILGQSTLDELLSQREQVNAKLQAVIDEQTEPWGVKVTAVEVKDVDLPQSMQRAMALQAEAEREKRAKIIRAQGEFQAAQTLADAAKVIGTQPATLQLRYLQTLSEIGADQNTVVVFPVPLDMFEPFLQLRRQETAKNGHKVGAADAPALASRPSPGSGTGDPVS
ncbi:MAG TPA: slipin family protein [Candidatus Nanopelagicaceae bacterium]|nr:slipin family protein [Candidatus Nanopelagicaceae bacterium]